MKKYLFTLLFLFLISTSFAQLSAVDHSGKEFAQFKTSKTYVVKTGNKNFDDAVEKAMKETWKITTYDFISQEELKNKLNDKTSSFLAPVVIDTDKLNQNYHYMALFNGGKKRRGAYNYDNMFSDTANHYLMDEKDITDCE